MTQWTAFVGVTGLVLSLFLALARLSQGAVRDGPTGDAPDGDAPDDRAQSAGGPVSPSVDRALDSADHPETGERESTRPEPTVPESVDWRSRSTEDPVRESRGDDSPPVRTTDSSPASTPATPRGATDGVGRGGYGPVSDRGPEEAGEASSPIAATAPGAGAGVERDPSGIDLSPGMLLLNVALTQGVFGAAVAGAAVYFAVPGSALGLSGAPLSTGLPAVGVGVGFGVVLWIGNELASILAESVGVAYDERLRGMLAPDSAGGWVLLLGGALPLVAAVEELLFRAAAVGVPAAAYGTSPWALAVVSSLAFALGHGAQGRTGMVVTGALGFALAAGFVLTNSLVVVVVAHYLVNALEFVVHEGLGVERPLG